MVQYRYSIVHQHVQEERLKTINILACYHNHRHDNHKLCKIMLYLIRKQRRRRQVWNLNETKSRKEPFLFSYRRIIFKQTKLFFVFYAYFFRQFFLSQVKKADFSFERKAKKKEIRLPNDLNIIFGASKHINQKFFYIVFFFSVPPLISFQSLPDRYCCGLCFDFMFIYI